MQAPDDDGTSPRAAAPSAEPLPAPRPPELKSPAAALDPEESVTDAVSPSVLDSFAACLSPARSPLGPVVAPGGGGDGGVGEKKKRLGEQRRCGACAACLLPDDCGACRACLDKPRFGGKNTLKQRCRERRCLNPKAIDGDPAPARKAPTTTKGGGEGKIKKSSKKTTATPSGPPKLTPAACILPSTYTVAARRPDFPPWALGEGPGPMTKSMVMADRGYPTRATSAEAEEAEEEEDMDGAGVDVGGVEDDEDEESAAPRAKKARVSHEGENEGAAEQVPPSQQQQQQQQLHELVEEEEEGGEPLTEEEARAKAEAEEKEKAEERAALAAAWERTSIPVRPMKDGGAKDGVSAAGIEVGMGADVEMTDEGLVGSRYSAVIRGLRPAPGGKRKPKEALVEYDTLHDEGEAEAEAEPGAEPAPPKRLQEWVPIASLHPVPPRPPDGWLSRVRPGDVLDALYEGGWWTVVVITCPTIAARPDAEPEAAAAGGAMEVDAAAEGPRTAPSTEASTETDAVAGAVKEALPSSTSASSPSDEAAKAVFKTEVKGYGIARKFCALDLRPCNGSHLLQSEA